MEKVDTALVGYGYWGKNLLRNIIEAEQSGSVFLYDTNPAAMAEAVKVYPGVRPLNSIDEILNNKELKAVVVASPTSTHYSIAEKLLQAGKHVLVEKPITTSLAEATRLGELARLGNCVLMVDHIFMYNHSIHRLKEYMTPDFIGRLNYIDATRVNLGIYQNDTNVLWDLACHDLSIINYILSEKPSSLRAIGRINPQYGVEDLAYLFLYYPSGILVHINSSWASPVKMRKMVIGAEKKMIIYDDIEPTNKLVIYDYEQPAANDVGKNKLADYRLGNITIPKYTTKEPLKNLMEEFYECIRTGKTPVTGSENAVEVVRLLEKAQESLNSQGAIIQLN